MRLRFLVSFMLCVALLSCAVSGAAQDETSARAFLNSIFRLYGNHGKGVENTPRYLHSSLIALIKEDTKAVGTDIPVALDGDLVCGCQQWDGIRIRKMDVHLINPQRAEALVSFSLSKPGGRPRDGLRACQYILVAEHGEWRIYDIEYTSNDTELGESRFLREQIKKEIESYAHPPKP